jgi:hypothetical protein
MIGRQWSNHGMRGAPIARTGKNDSEFGSKLAQRFFGCPLGGEG